MKDSLVSINQTPKPRHFILMCRAIIGLFLLLFVIAPIAAQVPTPRSVLGFQPTDDRTIADWTQITN